jgi:prepilin-type processing-associated H-X9-DG protein
MSGPNKRLNAYRPDLADITLKGVVDAQRFVEGTLMQVTTPVIGLFRQPSPTSMQLTQCLYGETLLCFDQKDDWSWIKLQRDGYVGYVPSHALSSTIHATTHEVLTLQTHLYPKPDLKTQPAINLPMLAGLSVTSLEKDYAAIAGGGFVFNRHLRPTNTAQGDYVTIATQFLGAPYYWGGKTVQGLDCSGLVQLALQATGIEVLRDSDMQEATLGNALSAHDMQHLKRGDFVFWDGHVGIMVDEENLLHANGHFMMVTQEPLKTATTRIAASGKNITSIRRL